MGPDTSGGKTTSEQDRDKKVPWLIQFNITSILSDYYLLSAKGRRYSLAFSGLIAFTGPHHGGVKSGRGSRIF